MSDPLSNEQELLFRQVHPGFIEDGQPSSQPFRPTPKDGNKLSVDRSAITTAEHAFKLYKANGFSTSAVYGLTVGEFHGEQISCFSNPLCEVPPLNANPAHALADYSPHNANQQKNRGKRLRQIAIARGQLHPPKAD